MKRIKNILLGVIGVCVSSLVLAQTSEVKDITPLGFSGDFIAINNSETRGLIAIGNNGCLYISNDTAKTWNVEKLPISVSKLLMQNDKITGYIFNSKTVYKTTDGTKSWTQMGLEGIPTMIDGKEVEFRNMFIVNTDTLLLIVSNKVNGVRFYLSNDGGNSWYQVAENMYSANIYPTIESIHSETSLHKYAYGSGFYAETFDGGNTWTKHLFDSYTEHVREAYSYDNGKAILFYQHGDKNLYQILKSDNGDPSAWQVVKSLDMRMVVKFEIFENVVYAVDGNGSLYISEDSASTWAEKTIYNGSQSIVNDMYFFDKNNGIVICDELTSFVTTDGGETWKKYVHAGAEGFNNLYCINEQECFITGTTGRLFRTQDGGETWTWEDIHNTGLKEIEFPTQDTGYIAGDQVLFMTINGGDTWAKKETGINGSLIEFPTSTSGYMGYDGTMTVIQKTTDKGDSWTFPVDANYMYNSIQGKFSFRTIDEGVVCGPDNLLLHTVDGGANWNIIDSISTFLLADVQYVSNKGWIVEALKNVTTGEIFYCDNDFNCQAIFEDLSLLGNLQEVNDSVYYVSIDTTEFMSYDYGITWEDLEIDLKGIVNVPSPHVAYSCYDYELKIYKAYINVSDISLSVTQNSSRNYTLTPTFSDNSIQVTIYVRDSQGALHEIAQNTTIQNGVKYTLEIPEQILAGSYSIYIEPQNSAYAPVESEVFEIGTGIPETTPNTCFQIHGNTIYFTDTEAKIYNIMGVELPINGTSIQLETGVYLIWTECGTEKIILK